MEQDKIFIPASIEDVAYRRANYFFSDKKAALIVVLILSYALIALMLLPLLKNAVGLLLFIFFMVFTGQLYIRKVIVEENRWLEIYSRNEENRISSIGAIWNIYDFQDKYIKYINQNKGLVVRLEMGSIVGKSEHFEKRHFTGVENFYRNLLRSGLQFIVMNIEEKPKMPENILYLENLLKNETNENLKSLIRVEVNHMKKLLMKRLDQENTYIFVYTNQPQLMRELTNVELFLKRLIIESGFYKYHILDKKEFLELSQNIHGIKYIDFDELISKSDVDLAIQPFKVLKKLDEEGYDLIDFEDDLPFAFNDKQDSGIGDTDFAADSNFEQETTIQIPIIEDKLNSSDLPILEEEPIKEVDNKREQELLQEQIEQFRRDIEADSLFIDDLNETGDCNKEVENRFSLIKKPEAVKKSKKAKVVERNLEGEIMPDEFVYKAKE